jgi:putative oxidoreductase
MRASPAFALLLVRLGFGLFLLAWGLNKIVEPEHAVRIFENYYALAGVGPRLSVVLGVFQVALALAILAGVYKTVTYGLGVLIHGASTLATLPHLVMPLAEGSNILFMAGLPVLTAAIGLFLAREWDTMLSFERYHFWRGRERTVERP